MRWFNGNIDRCIEFRNEHGCFRCGNIYCNETPWREGRVWDSYSGSFCRLRGLHACILFPWYWPAGSFGRRHCVADCIRKLIQNWLAQVAADSSCGMGHYKPAKLPSDASGAAIEGQITLTDEE